MRDEWNIIRIYNLGYTVQSFNSQQIFTSLDLAVDWFLRYEYNFLGE